MGTITPRRRRDGTVAYLAQITVKRDGAIFHRENRTFDREPAARAWIKKREKEARSSTTPLAKTKEVAATLGDAIDRYEKESLKEIGRTKAQVLRTIRKHAIADKRCDEISSEDLFAYAQELAALMQPQTVGNYMSHLAAVFAIARPAFGIPLNPQIMKDAMVVTKRMGLVTKSKSRERRPTMDELDLLMQHFVDRSARSPRAAPMHKIIGFALFSTRRQEEITRIAWSDLDEEHSRVLVRDMKHPGQKVGNDVWSDLPAEALAIIKTMPKKSARIFPYGTDAISAAFTRACQFLGIDDLRFHDLRHEGVSRLFEMGRTIPLAASVSGHRGWHSLQRYSHIRTRGDRYENWKWLPMLTAETKKGPAAEAERVTRSG